MLSRAPSPADIRNLRAYAEDVRSLIGCPNLERDSQAAINQTLGRPKTIPTAIDEED